jgi:glycosyltransferase involved in cell wall biosynthesis
MPRKILIITDNIPQQINGVVTTFKNIEQIAIQEGYLFYWITPLDFKHFSAPGYPEIKLAIPVGIKEKIKNIDPDYIHIATEGPVGLFTRLYLEKKGIPFNTSYHTKFPEFLKTIYKIPEYWTYRYLRWFHSRSSRILTTTESMVELLRDKGFSGEIISWTRGVNRSELVVSRNWDDFRTNKTVPTVLYVGRVSKEKNLEPLLELEDFYNIEIVGDGPHRKELEQKYKKVDFLGYKTGGDLADCYARADVFCFPSKTDTFGIVMIESMNFGTPIAGYPVQGPTDIVENGVNGCLKHDLKTAIDCALGCDRNLVKKSSQKWTWQSCWDIFKNNLERIHEHR